MRHTRLLVVVLLALVSLACAQEAEGTVVGDDSASGSDGDQAAADEGTDEDERGSDTIDWEECGGDEECAELEVPLDYDDPDGETITIDVLRVPASGDRIGALFVNPGGPGALGTEFAAGIAAAMPSDVTERFDIVGVNPRGLGASNIDCGGNFTELYGVDYSIDSPEDETTLLGVSQEYVDGCANQVGNEVLANLGTLDVARDMDQVRDAMGDEQLSYLGFSYGTAIGQVYANEFPDRVRAMVIDGVLELGPTGIDLAEEQARAFERALQAFADDCDADDTCPIGPDAMAAVDELSRRVEEAPIPGEPRALGPGDLAIGLAMPLYTEMYWPMLADAVDAALDGDGSEMISLADQYLDIGNFDIYFAVNCLDFEWPEEAAELLADGAAMAAEAPHFGPSIVNDYVRCAMWPVEEEPLEAVTAPGTPPILVISTTNDPATPYEAGVRTAERLEEGVLLTYEGEGHGVAFTGVPCVDDAIVEYLIDLEPPEDGTTCD